MKEIDYNSVAFFFRHRTLDRMIGWEDQLDLIRKKHSEVAEAYDRMITAKKTFDVLMDNMIDGATEYGEET